MQFFANARVVPELSLSYAVENNDGQELVMSRPHRSSQKKSLIQPRKVVEGERDFLQVRRSSGGKDALASASLPQPSSSDTAARTQWPPIPDLFDVITYFRARGDSFSLIASIGFWVGEKPTRALTARGLKLWYEAELERRSAAKAAIR
jgi:hypothetical protein